MLRFSRDSPAQIVSVETARPGSPGLEGAQFIAHERALGQLSTARALKKRHGIQSDTLKRQTADFVLDRIDFALTGDTEIADAGERARHQHENQRVVHQATGALDYLATLERAEAVPKRRRLKKDIRKLRDATDMSLVARYFDPARKVTLGGNAVDDSHGFNLTYALVEEHAEAQHPDAKRVSVALDEVNALHQMIEFIGPGNWAAFTDTFFTALIKLPTAEHQMHERQMLAAIDRIEDRPLRAEAAREFETGSHGRWFEPTRGAVED